MITSSQIKLIRSLQQKKFRDKHMLYVMEGEKLVEELTGGRAGSEHRIHKLFANGEWIGRNKPVLSGSGIEAVETEPSAMKKVSKLVTPSQVLALVHIPDTGLNEKELAVSPVLAFESIRDPGNLGTIIRTADWFGIGQVICTPDSADVYNPKVVQASMGAITRVRVSYADITKILENAIIQGRAVYGTFLDGDNIYQMSLDKNPVILFGNESRGLSDRYDPYISQRLSIPSFSRKRAGSESLNVASSVAVICSELTRSGN
ncbi:MAG: RNA methyltransferase [Bacteroidota bacterium]